MSDRITEAEALASYKRTKRASILMPIIGLGVVGIVGGIELVGIVAASLVLISAACTFFSLLAPDKRTVWQLSKQFRN